MQTISQIKDGTIFGIKIRMKATAKYLKMSVIFLFLIIVIPAWVYGEVVMVSWEANTETGLGGYRVYYGTSSMTYTQSLDVSPLINSIEIGDLSQGYTYYFAITAYDTEGYESAYSEEVSVSIPEGDPPPDEDNSVSLGAGSGGGGGGCFISSAIGGAGI